MLRPRFWSMLNDIQGVECVVPEGAAGTGVTA